MRRARPRRRKRGEGAEAAPEAGEAQEAAGRDRVLSALGNQGVQRLLRGGGERSPVVQRQGPGPEGGEDSEEAAAAELDEALPDSDSDSEEQAEPEADIYELSPEVATSGPVVEAMVGGAAGDLEAGGPGAEQNASEKEQEALDEIEGVKPEVEGFGNALLISHLRGLRQSLLLDTTILRPYVGEDAVSLDSAQSHLRNVSSAFAAQYTEESANEAGGVEEPPEAAPGAG